MVLGRLETFLAFSLAPTVGQFNLQLSAGHWLNRKILHRYWYKVHEKIVIFYFYLLSGMEYGTLVPVLLLLGISIQLPPPPNFCIFEVCCTVLVCVLFVCVFCVIGTHSTRLKIERAQPTLIYVSSQVVSCVILNYVRQTLQL